MTERIVDYSLAGESVAEHLKNAIQLLDADQRHGFWERRASVAALRKRLLAALALLEPREP